MIRNCLALSIILLAAPASLANPFAVPVDSTQSSLQVELCISGSCDTDISPLQGSWMIDLDAVDTPTSITLFDLMFQATQDLVHHIEIVIIFPLGDFDSTTTGLEILYATPGWPSGPAPVVTDAFTFFNVPLQAEGALAYIATGVVCDLLTNAGQLCIDTRDLGLKGVQTADQINGTVTSIGGVVTLASTGSIQRPLDPANPGLGDITLTWTVHGEVLVPDPLPGDLDGDGDVDSDDYTTFSACFSGPGVTIPPPGCHPTNFANADLDGELDVDCDDWDMFALAFENSQGVPPDVLGECLGGIPTTSQWGLMVMAMLVLTAGTLVHGTKEHSLDETQTGTARDRSGGALRGAG